jgi:hypothetical protein
MDTQPLQSIEKIRQVRDQLADQLISQLEVSLVDIGADPLGDSSSLQLVVRVHVRHPDVNLGLPDEIDGVPVRVVTGDYHLE